jgi:hypothetical protein
VKLTFLDNRPRPKILKTSPSEPVSPNNDQSPKSPTWSLTELLQALEDHDRDSLWYVDRGNELCRLLARFPGLKWELSWSAFIGRYLPGTNTPVNVELMRYFGVRERRKLRRDIELLDTLSLMCKV